MKEKLERILNYDVLYIILFLIFLTSSFDICLTAEVAGFTFRFSQLLCAVLLIYYFYKIIKNKKIEKPLGGKQLICWTILVLLFTFNTIYPFINVGYHLWLIFNVAIVICITQIVDKENIEIVLKLYLLSYLIMAIIGILQCITGVLNINNPFIVQWWIKGVLPRVNGFSFEPSYYATYMLIGWTIARILIRSKEFNKRKDILISLVLITIAIILSSSRMSIALMILIEGMLFLKNFYYSEIKEQDKYKKELQVQLILAIILIIIVSIAVRLLDLSFLLNGLGINGSKAHSVLERSDHLINVLEVFKDSPIFGRGLGGIYVEMAVNKGINIENVNPQDVATGTAVFAEVLAASGIIGFAVFMWYILTLIIKPIKLLKDLNEKEKTILKSILIALIVELVILQLNQNILRIYLWIHIGILSAVFNVYKGEKK